MRDRKASVESRQERRDGEEDMVGDMSVCLILEINGKSLRFCGENENRLRRGTEGKGLMRCCHQHLLYGRTRHAGRDRRSRAIEAEQTIQLWTLSSELGS